MPIAGEQFREAHEALRESTALLREAAAAVPGLAQEERGGLRERVLAALSTVESHMNLDERVLYPEVVARLGDPLATASMSYDHRAIAHWLQRLRDTPLDEPDLLQELLYGLDALIRVHVWKEDELYLHMLESPSWPGGS